MRPTGDLSVAGNKELTTNNQNEGRLAHEITQIIH